MFMTANRLKIDGKPVLKLTIHDFPVEDIPFLEGLGITQIEEGKTSWRYALIHSQEDFLKTRSLLLEKYEVVEEKGPQVFLKTK